MIASERRSKSPMFFSRRHGSPHLPRSRGSGWLSSRENSSQRPLPSAERLSSSRSFAASSIEVMRVHRGVLEHVRRQRPHRPVGALMRLVRPSSRNAARAAPPVRTLRSRGAARRPMVSMRLRDREAEVAVEDAQVVVGAVQDLRDRRIGEHVAEARRDRSCASGSMTSPRPESRSGSGRPCRSTSAAIGLGVDGDDRLGGGSRSMAASKRCLLVDPDHSGMTRAPRSPIDRSRPS